MDQTINEVVYSKRIADTVRNWNEQMSGKPAVSGTIIGSDGTEFRKIDGKLVQVLDPSMLKRLKRLENKLISDGLVSAESLATSSAKAEEEKSAGMIAEM